MFSSYSETISFTSTTPWEAPYRIGSLLHSERPDPSRPVLISAGSQENVLNLMEGQVRAQAMTPVLADRAGFTSGALKESLNASAGHLRVLIIDSRKKLSHAEEVFSAYEIERFIESERPYAVFEIVN